MGTEILQEHLSSTWPAPNCSPGPHRDTTVGRRVPHVTPMGSGLPWEHSHSGTSTHCHLTSTSHLRTSTKEACAPCYSCQFTDKDCSVSREGRELEDMMCHGW